MDFSIIISTYNRSEMLKTTLNSIRNLYVSDDMSWELIIVDNNSNDNTRNVVKEFSATNKIRTKYIYEIKQGKPYALNSALKIAKGNIIAFTDDDVILEKHWLVNIAKAFKKTDAICIGGKVLPKWEQSPPKWLGKELYGCIALLDLGNEYLRLTEPTLWGVNMAVKSSIFKKGLQFNTGLPLHRGEDTEFVKKVISMGQKVYYCPHVIVYHCIPETRMKKSYFRNWKYEQGKFRAILMGKCTNKNIMGVPLFAIRLMAKKMFRYVWLQISAPSEAFIEQVHFIHYLGLIIGRFQYSLSCKPQNNRLEDVLPNNDTKIYR